MKLGIIAEDESDGVVLAEIARKAVYPRKVGFRYFYGRGCSHIHRKCRKWTEVLLQEGHRWIVIARDLDGGCENALRQDLASKIDKLHWQRHIILLPAQMIEAWLLCDARALRVTFNGRQDPRLPSDPESIRDPKQFLGRLVRKHFRKEYVHTTHNEKIVKHIHLHALMRSRSFRTYPPFLSLLKEKLG